jgi:hypothetical protein
MKTPPHSTNTPEIKVPADLTAVTSNAMLESVTVDMIAVGELLKQLSQSVGEVRQATYKLKQPQAEMEALVDRARPRLSRQGHYQFVPQEAPEIPYDIPGETSSSGSSMKTWVAAVLGAMLMALGGSIWLRSQHLSQSEADPELMAALQQPESTLAKSLTHEDLFPAAKLALEGFLNAQTIAEKLAHVCQPDRVQPLMQKYYEKHPDEVDEVQHYQKTELIAEEDAQRSMTALQRGTVNEGETPLLLFFKVDAMGKARLDWEFYTQLKDASARQFISSVYTLGSQTMRVGLIRAHPRTPEQQGQICFALSALESPGEQMHFTADQSSLLGQILNAKINWAQPLTATVVLERSQQAESMPRLVLKKLICWESLGLGTETELNVSGTAHCTASAKEMALK